MITRCIAFNDQPLCMNLSARQSSSSGCVGFLPVLPKLLGLPAIGWPKCQSQTRFIITRAVSGLSFDVIHCASARRRPVISAGMSVLSVEKAEATPSAAGCTGRAGLKGSPPARIETCSRSPAVIRSAGMRRGAVTDFTCGVRPLYTLKAMGS